jgi:hypothetical protein
MFTREAFGSTPFYYQIMDKALLNIDPTTGVPTPYGIDNTIKSEVLKSTSQSNPSTVNVRFRSGPANKLKDPEIEMEDG